MYGTELLFADYRYAPLFGWLCLTAALFFVFRRPAANAFLSLSLTGVGGVPLIGGYTYARLSLFVGVLTVLALILRRKQAGAVNVRALVRTPLAWFAGVCVVIMAKTLLETAIYGLDPSRSAGLLGGLQEVIFPTIVLLLGVTRSSLEATQQDLLIGMATFPILTVAGYLPFELSQGQLQSAWFESNEFALGSLDTINSAHILAYGAIASMLVFILPRKRRAMIAFFAACTALGFAVLVILTGNRQFLLALLGFLLLWAFFLQVSSRTRWLASIIVLAGLVYAMTSLVLSRDLALVDRVSVTELQSEAAEGRGAIWLRAFHAILDHPILGSGYKNFGDEVDSVDRHGRPVVLHDSAHGVFQDVFTEHGVFLGSAFLAGCIFLIVRSWRAILGERRLITVGKAMTAGLLALILPLPFSSVFLNATPIFLLLVMAMARDGRSRDDSFASPGTILPELNQPARTAAFGRSLHPRFGRR